MTYVFSVDGGREIRTWVIPAGREPDGPVPASDAIGLGYPGEAVKAKAGRSRKTVFGCLPPEDERYRPGSRIQTYRCGRKKPAERDADPTKKREKKGGGDEAGPSEGTHVSFHGS